MLSMVVCLKIFDEMTSRATFKHFFKLKLWADIQIDTSIGESRVIQNLQSYKVINMKEAVSSKWLWLKNLKIRIPKGIIGLVHIRD